MHLAENLPFAERYKLVKLLGRGGFSEVWLANDQWTGLDVAVKVYAPNQSLDADGLKDFSKELANVYNLNHTNLLKPQHVDTWQGMPYLIMAFCENGSCYKHVGKLTEDEAWKLIENVASGLAYLHSSDVIHQDIKPDNILIDDNGNYLITDFGISVKSRSTLRKSVNNASSSGGTTAYMAPERFSKDPKPLKASDIWSLGATVYELITGRLPFGEVGGGMQRSGASIPTINVEISPILRNTLARMLAEDPEDRPSASVLADWAQNPSAISLLSQEDLDNDDGGTMLKVRPSRVAANPAGEEVLLYVKTDKEWRFFSEDNKWCKAEKKDDETICLKIKPNQTGEERKSNINIIAGSRASIVPVSQISLPKRKRTLYYILAAIIAVLGIAVVWNVNVHNKKEQQKIEGFIKIYDAEIKNCNIYIKSIEKNKVGDVGHPADIKNALESLKKIERWETDPKSIFKKTNKKPCYNKMYTQFKTSLAKAEIDISNKYNEQVELGLAVSSNTYYWQIKEKLELIQDILGQAQKVDAAQIVPSHKN